MVAVTALGRPELEAVERLAYIALQEMPIKKLQRPLGPVVASRIHLPLGAAHKSMERRALKNVSDVAITCAITGTVILQLKRVEDAAGGALDQLTIEVLNLPRIGPFITSCAGHVLS